MQTTIRNSSVLKFDKRRHEKQKMPANFVQMQVEAVERKRE